MGLTESIVNLIAAMSTGDAVVKARFCQREPVNALFGLSMHLPPPLQLRVLRAVRRLSSEQSVLAALEAANAVPYVVAQLARQDSPAMQGEALAALQNLCQLNRARQEAAALAGAAPFLCRLSLQQPIVSMQGGSPALAAARSTAVGLLCSLIHAGPRARAELWQHGGIDVLLQLIMEEAHRPAALEALATWVEAEGPRVEQRLTEEGALSRLASLLPPSPSDVADPEALQVTLASLARVLARSMRLAAALASAGLAQRAISLLHRASAAIALSLLELIRLLYEAHPRPKEFIARYRVAAALNSLAHGSPAAGQVLVRKRAQNLLDAFQLNTVL
jgi:hypothetical protein